MLHPPLYMSFTSSFFCTAQVLFPAFPTQPPICIPPHPLPLLDLLPRLSPLWMTCPHLLLQRVQLTPALPPISDSSPSYVTPSLPPTSLQPRPAPYARQQLQRRCALLMSNCQPSFYPLPPSFLPSPLSGPGRLGYALITLSILPSCQPPCSRAVTAQGHHGSAEELWVSKNRTLEQPISWRTLWKLRRGLV